MAAKQKLLEKAHSLPTSPGCYLMKSLRGDILYIGKAKNLKNRVTSYFNNSSKSPKTEILVSHIRDFDFILTGSDTEAFVLENNLIKKHSPKYNIRLKDDRSYPYVVVNFNEDFPRLEYDRRPKRKKGVKVFGPFVVGSNISEIMRILTKSFSLRDCSLREFQSRKEPCLLFQMKQCSAPCTEEISKENYLEDLNQALNIFSGNGKETIKVLEIKMQEAASEEAFERAAYFRDAIDICEKFLDFSQQKNAEIGLGESQNNEKIDIDILAWHEGEVEVEISLYMIRNSMLLGHKNFHFLSLDQIDGVESEVLNFLHQYYTSTYESLPDKIIIPPEIKKEDRSVFAKALNISLEGKKMEVQKVSQPFQSLYDLTKNHAFESQRVRLKQSESVLVALNKLMELLSLKERPRVIECYDIAIWQGKSPTASKVVFHDGKPDKKNYRHYNLEELPEGNNDFAMMKETLNRRLKSGMLPDLFLVDGGIQQVNVFIKALEENKVDIPVVGIAKARNLKSSQYEKEVSSSDERLIIPKRSNPYILKKCLPLLRLLVSMRDEAHRFSRRLHHKKEKSRIIQSWLDEISGIGEKQRNKILKRIDVGLEELKRKNAKDLEDYLQVSAKLAVKIYDKLQSL